MQTPEADAVHQAIQRTWRAECARIVAVVARLTRDVGLAEECAQDALVAALEHWPRDGVPDRPGAWLTTAARHKALDHLRRAQRMAREHEALGHDLDAQQALTVPDIADGIDARRDDDIGDDLLRLIFIACHPLLSTDARVALTLRLLGGLGTAEIARAFLVPEPTVAQRIVRAKRTLAEAKVPFEVPRGEERSARLTSVLEVIYLIFNEGYASSGEFLQRPDLATEAILLARLLIQLLPANAEAEGLLALMLLNDARREARTTTDGLLVPLDEQDRSLWNRASIAAGTARSRSAC